MREGERDVVALHLSNACSDSTRLSVRRTSWMCSRIPALSILPASTTCGAGGIVRQPVLQFSVLGLLALQGTSTTAPGGGESYPYMGICHGPPRSVRRPPPRAIHIHTEYTSRVKVNIQAGCTREASSTVPRGTIVRFSPAFSREASSTAPRGTIVSNLPG